MWFSLMKIGVVMVSLCSTLNGAWADEAVNPAEQGGKTDAFFYLVRMARKLDCYYTIEWKQVGINSSFPVPDIPIERADENINTREELTQKLQDIFQNFSISQDKRNPVVIRLIDKGLDTEHDYPLNRSVHFTFSDYLGKLPQELGRHFEGRVRTPIGGSLEEILPDFSIKVSFVAKQTAVRSILTDYLPLYQRSRILWRARTLDVNLPPEIANQRQTWVKLPGRRTIFLSSKVNDIRPFLEGEVAYDINPYTEEIAKVAINFIDTEMQKPKPHQVRWAMLYLGKHKAERAIPLLLKHLDYQYTTVPLLEEAYPAVRALTMMGPAALPAVQEAWTKETNTTRLLLLTKVLWNAQGADKAKPSIQALIAKTGDKQRQTKMQEALQQAEAAPSAEVLP